jgi:ubiquinone/menaquinone biosynthesis C-methylase UbiE
MSLLEKNRGNLKKYNLTAWFYDVLDFPWERRYRKWRPRLVGDLRGHVLEAGVGTGRNLRYYHPEARLTALDFSPAMLTRSRKRAGEARCRVDFLHDDACTMESVQEASFDWVVATFLCCVIPGELQPEVIRQFGRVLRPGGRFRLLEMVYSEKPRLRKRQDFFTPFVEKVYGARFDRNTLEYVRNEGRLRVTQTRFLHHDVYLLIEGERVE